MRHHKIGRLVVATMFFLNVSQVNLAQAGDLPVEKKEAVVEFDGSQAEKDLQLSNTITKVETTYEDYQDTCYRQEPDGTETKCETLYRSEQECGSEWVCHDRQECSQEYQCHDRYRCHDKQDCGYQDRCHPVEECHNERDCRIEQRCDVEQDCSGTRQVCKDDRDCEVVDGKRVCTVKQVCTNEPVCESRRVCHDERVCDDRPVCRTENRCSSEYVCETRQECGNEQECGYETECRTVPECGNETVCRTVQIPYQSCSEVPKYKSVPYTCTKQRPIYNTVLDFVHKADVKVQLSLLNPLPKAEKFKFSFLKEKLKLEAVENLSGHAFFFTAESKTSTVVNKEKTTSAVLRITGFDKTDLIGKLKIKELKADKKGLSFIRGNVADLSGWRLSYKLVVEKIGDKKVIDRALTEKEYTVDPATGLVTVSFDKLGIAKATKKKGEFRVEVRSELALPEKVEWVPGSVADLNAKEETKFKNRGIF